MKEQNGFKSRLTDLIDDAAYRRFDKRKCALYYDQYLGEGHTLKMKKKAREDMIDGIRQNKPGLVLKDRALLGAAWLQDMSDRICPGPNKSNAGVRSWTNVNKSLATPRKLGVDRYTGDPKGAARMVKQAGKIFGACRVGITGLDQRHVYQYECDGKEIVFETVEEPYETPEKRVIPEKCQYAVVMLVQMSAEALACAPFPVGSVMPALSYNRIDYLTGAVAEFIRGLGYTAIPSANDISSNGPLAIEAGLGEQCRMDKVIHPDFGPLIRICKVLTDLPLELDQRQNFGVTEFCKTCRRCVEACPVKAINEEREPSFSVPGPWVNPGHKTWHGNNPRCWAYAESTGGGCGICLTVCPWNKPRGIPHSLVRAVVRKTPLFNRLLVAADKFFGYGKPMNPEEWWNLDVPTYGIDTRR